MHTELREKGHQIFDEVPDEHIPTVVHWLELLATGALKTMADEAENEAQSFDDWRTYLDEL